MNLEFDLKRPDPLYFAWKNAVNDPSTSDAPWYCPASLQRARAQEALKEKYGCETLEVRRKDDRYLTGVRIKFSSEQALTWFLLKWS